MITFHKNPTFEIFPSLCSPSENPTTWFRKSTGQESLASQNPKEKTLDKLPLLKKKLRLQSNPCQSPFDYQKSSPRSSLINKMVRITSRAAHAIATRRSNRVADQRSARGEAETSAEGERRGIEQQTQNRSLRSIIETGQQNNDAIAKNPTQQNNNVERVMYEEGSVHTTDLDTMKYEERATRGEDENPNGEDQLTIRQLRERLARDRRIFKEN